MVARLFEKVAAVNASAVGLVNFLKWVLIFHIHNMTSQLPSVEHILEVMDEHGTNPLIAYYMIRYVLTYDEAVAYYQRHNHYLTAEQEHSLEVLRYILLTDLSAEEIELLLQINVDDFTKPTPEELQRFKAANPGHMTYNRFKYGVRVPGPRRVEEPPSVAYIQKVMAEHGTNPLIAYYMIRNGTDYETALALVHLDGPKFAALNPDEVKLLESVPFNGNPWRQPAPGEAERMYPDSKYPVQRFLFDCTEEEAAKHALDAKKGD